MTTQDQTTSQKPQHTIFINEMALHGRQRRAYMAAHPGCTPETADRGAHRLMEKPEIRARIEAAREKINHQRQQILKKELTCQLRRLQDKEEVIAQIFKGELQKTIYGKGGIMLHRAEDPRLRLHAMKQDTILAKERKALLNDIARVPGLAEELGVAMEVETELTDIAEDSFVTALLGEEPAPVTTENDIVSYEEPEPEEAPAVISKEETANTSPEIPKITPVPEEAVPQRRAKWLDEDGNPKGIFATLSPEQQQELTNLREQFMASTERSKKALEMM